MQELAFWFENEVQSWRTGASVTWTVILTVPVTFIFAALARVDILRPLTCPIDLLWLVSSPSSWGYLGMLAFIIGIVGAVNAKHYSARASILRSRFAIIWSVLKPVRLVRTTAHALAAGVATWCFVALVGGRYKGLSKPCGIENSSKPCLNEHHVFAVLHGVYTGCLVAANFFRKHQTYMPFPIVQQSKFFQVKASLLPSLVSSAVYVLGKLKYYYLLYYLFLGSIFKSGIAGYLQLAESDVAVDSMTGLLDIALFYHVWLVGTLIHFLFSLSALLYKVYQTEPFEFPISSALEEFKNKRLHNAVTCTTNPLIQYLGYQDLWLLSRYSPARRTEIFSLTHLGGHPHHWTALSSSCLATLQEFVHQIKAFNSCSLGGGPVRQLSGDCMMGPPQMGPNTYTSSLNGSSLTSPMATPVSTLTHRGAAARDDNLNLTTPKTSEQYGTDRKKPGIMQKFVEQLKRRHAVAMFVADLPDTASRNLFSEAQKYIWAVEALSYLAIASFTEDKYGVVQKTMPDIMTTLLNLQEAVEKHFKLATNMSRKPGKDPSQGCDSSLRYVLKASLRTSLYRLVVTFDQHLSAIPLSR